MKPTTPMTFWRQHPLLVGPNGSGRMKDRLAQLEEKRSRELSEKYRIRKQAGNILRRLKSA